MNKNENIWIKMKKHEKNMNKNEKNMNKNEKMEKT
jgi:hypothetical protein